MKTYSPRPEHIERRWFVIDASGAVLGRVASEAAAILRGKHKPIFAPHMDTGDHVVIVNAAKVELTGGKEAKKLEYRHSGYPGGIRATAYGSLLSERPAYLMEKAVRGMLPKNRLGRSMIKKLHVVPGPQHPHAAQRPVAVALGERPAWYGLPLRSEPGPEPADKKAGPAKKTTAKRPGAKRPTAKKTTAKKPTAEREAGPAKKPTAGKPAAKKPTAKKLSAKKPTHKRVGAKPMAKEKKAGGEEA